MKKWKGYAIVVAVLLFLAKGKMPGTDIGKLEPVEAVQIYSEKGQTVVCTDTGQWGKGKNLEEAYRQMKETASREVYLETAVWLLTDTGSLAQLPEMESLFRPNCRVCLYEGKEELKELTAYLDHQKPDFLLRDIGRKPIPILSEQGGQHHLEKQQTK